MNRAERRRVGPSTGRKGFDRRILVYGTVALVAVLIIVAVAFSSRTPKTASEAPDIASIKVGDDAPAFSVASTGGPVSVPNPQKKPVFLEVFATWCPHCQHETSTISQLYKQYGNRITFVAVSGNPYGMDGRTPESQADVATFITKFNAHYPVAYDADLKVMKEYLQGGYPTIVVIGKDNKIRSIRSGEVSQNDLAKDLDDALKA